MSSLVSSNAGSAEKITGASKLPMPMEKKNVIGVVPINVAINLSKVAP